MKSNHKITYIGDPTSFYAENKGRLDSIGGSAFSQDPAEFGRQVAERFEKSEIAQSIYVGCKLVGFALYTTIRGHLWRQDFIC